MYPMTSTSQKKTKDDAEPKEPASKVQAEKTPETASDQPPKDEKRTVPLEALAEQREKRREAETRLEAIEKELAALKATKGPNEPNPSDDSDVRKALKELQDRDRLRAAVERKRDLMVELGLSSAEQADVIAEIQAKNPDLSPVEALDMATRRKPDLFQDRGRQGYDPAIHGSSRPQSTGGPPQPKKPDRQRRMEAMKKSTGKDQMDIFYDYVGNLAQEAMGWGQRKNRVQIPE